MTKNQSKQIEKEDNSNDYPEISTALFASARLLVDATKKSGLENPEISTVLNISDGRKFLITFERVDLD